MGELKKNRIFIVDDHPILREGLESVLAVNPDIEVCGGAGSVREALEQIEAVAPDLVVTDLSLPDRNGLELIKDLRAAHPEIPVLVVSMHDENVYAERALRAGAKGYIMKEAALDRIAQAIRQVIKGDVYVSEAITKRLLQMMTRNAGSDFKFPLETLSDRELDVFELIGQGKSSQEIGKQLGISPRTVNAHRTNIRKKLDLGDGAVLLAHAIKWVESSKFES